MVEGAKPIIWINDRNLSFPLKLYNFNISCLALNSSDESTGEVSMPLVAGALIVKRLSFLFSLKSEFIGRSFILKHQIALLFTTFKGQIHGRDQ